MSAVDFIKDWAQLIVVGTAAIGVLFTLWRKVMRPITAMSDVVKLQLTENGGGSLIDKVNQIQPNHEEAQRNWGELKANQETLKQQQVDAKGEREVLAVALAQTNEELAAKLEDRAKVWEANHAEAQQHWTALGKGQAEIKASFAAGVKNMVQREQTILSRLDKLDTKAVQTAIVHNEHADEAKTEIIERIDDLETGLASP